MLQKSNLKNDQYDSDISSQKRTLNNFEALMTHQKRHITKQILFDGTGMISKETGMSKYCINIVNHIMESFPKNEYSIILHPGFSNLELLPKSIKVLAPRVPHFGLRRQLLYIKLRETIISKFDIFHCLTGRWPFPIRGGINTLHDLRFLPRYSEHNILNQSKRKYLKYNLNYSLKFCDKIICVSSSTKNDVLSLNDKYQDKYIVVHHGFDPIQLPADEKSQAFQLPVLSSPFILFVGEMQRNHKNAKGLIEGFIAFKQQYDKWNTKLVLAGQGKASILKSIPDEFREDINIVGYVDKNKLYHLYSQASIFALLSFVEGFGFPLLEAMSFKVPIICSNIPSLSETAGNAALKVDPLNKEQISQAFFSILDSHDLRTDLINKGKTRLLDFNWEKTAKLTYEIYKDCFKSQTPD